MQFNTLFLFLCATGVMAAPRILGCRMANGSLNPSGNICTSAGGKVAGTVRIRHRLSQRDPVCTNEDYTGQMLHKWGRW